MLGQKKQDDFPGWGSPAASICWMQSSRVHPHSIRGYHFLGLLMTIVTAKNQREALRQGIVRMVKRGERYDKPEVAPAEGGNVHED